MERNFSKLTVPVLVGPTSSGKTSLAVSLCRSFGFGGVVSADSRQIYKQMNIGTGKVPVQHASQYSRKPQWTICDVPIWGYDLVSPGDYFSVYDFALWGRTKLQKLILSGVSPVIAGGTGLYIDFLTGRLGNEVYPPDFEFRRSLESLPLRELQKRVDRSGASLTPSDYANKRRLIRALERYKASQGASYSKLPDLPPITFKFFGLSAPRAVLYSRADAWVDSIWETDAIIAEVSSLLVAGFASAHQLKGMIYREVVDFLSGLVSRDVAIRKTKYAVHAYIRRQQTYFKRNTEILWLDITDISTDKLAETVYNHLQYDQVS